MRREKIKRTPRSDRGFVNYGEPVICTYGTEIEVYESSSAEGPHVWLKLPGESVAHLNAKQAKAVIARLQAFLDDIPKLWGEGYR